LSRTSSGADLADVVEQCCGRDQLGRRLWELELGGDQSCRPTDALDVLSGLVVTIFGGQRQPVENVVPGALYRREPDHTVADSSGHGRRSPL
jgi:hypothetical protein